MRSKFVYFLLFLIALILFINYFFFSESPYYCSSIQSVNASIAVQEGPRRIVGLNADTDSLRFGVVSPQTVARRSVYVTNGRDAKVTVSMAGDLAPWVNITPDEFEIKANEDYEVKFAVRVPDYPQEGDYLGEVLFCFKE